MSIAPSLKTPGPSDCLQYPWIGLAAVTFRLNVLGPGNDIQENYLIYFSQALGSKGKKDAGAAPKVLQ